MQWYETLSFLEGFTWLTFASLSQNVSNTNQSAETIEFSHSNPSVLPKPSQDGSYLDPSHPVYFHGSLYLNVQNKSHIVTWAQPVS